MNQKKAKLMRKALKDSGIDWRESDYVLRKEGYYQNNTTQYLKQNCGRQIYKGMKLLDKQRNA